MTAVVSEPAAVSRAPRGRRWWFLAAAVLVAGLAAGLLVSRPWQPGPAGGPLQVHKQFVGYNITGPSRVGKPNVFSFVLFHNPTGRPATVIGVRLRTRLEVRRVALANPRGWHADSGVYHGWPPSHDQTGDLLRLPATIPPHRSTMLFTEVVIPRPGRYPIDRAVRVFYRVGRVTYTKVFTPIKPDVLYTR